MFLRYHKHELLPLFRVFFGLFKGRRFLFQDECCDGVMEETCV